MDEGLSAARLPLPLTPLIGRASEVAAARAMLDEVRLLTLVGTGGSGKTRLAIEVAAGEPGATFVDVAPLRTPAQVLPTVARALGLRDAGAQALAVTLQRHLRNRRVLLLLDNFEHLLDAAGDLAGLLAVCPRVRMLVTSRAPLQVPGEHLLPVTPLPVPDPLCGHVELAAIASAALFVARVRAAQPEFALAEENARTVAEICVALDGLPLALELAAAQVRGCGPEETLARSRRRFSLLQLPRRGVPQRHRTLAAAVQWSVELLDEPAAGLFPRLSVFAGGWTVEAAQEVCGAPGQDVVPALAALVDQSLAVAAPAGTGVRYRLLETLREFGTGRLEERGESEEFHRRHLVWCRGIAAAVRASNEPDYDGIGSLDRAEAEFDNIRAALEGCLPRDVPEALRIAADLYHFWDVRGYLGEGRRHLERLLARAGAAVDPATRAAALDALGLLLLWQDDHAAARTALGESAALSEQIGDLDRWAWSTSSVVISRAMLGDVEGAEASAVRAVQVARGGCTDACLGRALCGLALLRSAQGRKAEATELMQEGLGRLKWMTWGRGKFSYFLGWFAFLDGDLGRADDLLAQSVAAFECVGERRSLPDTLDAQACVAQARNEPAHALRLFGRSAAIRARTGARRHTYLRSHCEGAGERARAALASPPPGISAREIEVARLIADGLTNRQIGGRLAISERTAERHVENLRAKLGVRTRAQVAAWVAAVPTTSR